MNKNDMQEFVGSTKIIFATPQWNFLKWMQSHWKQRRGRAMLLKGIVKLFPKLNKVTIRIHDTDLPLDLRNDSDIGYFYSNGIGHEKFYQKVLLELITENTTFYDVGSNLGYYSLLLSPLVRNVYAFEPNPFLSQRLDNAIADNHLQNIKVFKIGLSNVQSQMMFYFNKSNHVLGSFIRSKHHSQSLIVDVSTLDNITEESSIKKPDIIKIDTEGYELNVLEGYTKIADQMPVIFMEWIIPFDQQAEMANRLIRIVGNEYEIYKIGHDSRLVTFSDNSFQDYSDLFLIPKLHPSINAIRKWI